jgi:intracellular septation protein
MAAYVFRLRIVGGGPVGWMIAAGGAGPRDLVMASWWLVGGSAVALLIGLAHERRVAPLPLVAGGFALVFGALTLAFHDPRFVKIKPTAAYLAYGLGLLGARLFRHNPLKALMDHALVMPEAAWRTLSTRYALFFLAMAGANEAVWRTQTDMTWAWFHFPGAQILAVLFSLSQLPLIMKHAGEAHPPLPPTE